MFHLSLCTHDITKTDAIKINLCSEMMSRNQVENLKIFKRCQNSSLKESCNILNNAEILLGGFFLFIYLWSTKKIQHLKCRNRFKL